MEETYKGYKIEYSDFQEKFTAYIGDSNYSNVSLAKVKKYIDDLEKKDFKRVDIIISDYNGRFRDAVITSIPEDTPISRPECWISYKEKTRGYGGSRQKTGIDNCILDIEANRKLIETIKEKRKIVAEVQSQIRELENQLIRYQLSTEND